MGARTICALRACPRSSGERQPVVERRHAFRIETPNVFAIYAAVIREILAAILDIGGGQVRSHVVAVSGSAGAS